VVRRFMERGPRPERVEHENASERDQGLVSHGRHSTDGVTVVGGGRVTLGREPGLPVTYGIPEVAERCESGPSEWRSPYGNQPPVSTVCPEKAVHAEWQ
jgi:hypothetical protein